MTLRPCLSCGIPSPDTRCPECNPPETKAGSTERGYDYRWQQLSARAIRAQPFCSDCGSTSDLTTDHSEEAWRRKAEGKVIRLCDVDVLCRTHNTRKGRARPTGDGVGQSGSRPPGKAHSPLHTIIILNGQEAGT